MSGHVQFPLLRSNIDSVPPNARGVYAFLRRDNDECIYVGKAVDQPIKNRLRAHWRHSHNEKLRLWIRAFAKYLKVCYKPVRTTNPEEIDRLERKLIKVWRPQTNIQHND